MKGKVDIKWYGHGGFRVQFKDKDDKQRCLYFDQYVGTDECPEEDKKEPPNDADLVFVTCGQMDCSFHSIDLIKFSKKEGRKIICTGEVSAYYQMMHQMPNTFPCKMQPGGTVDFDYVKVTMVRSDTSSTLSIPKMGMMEGGKACGYVISIPNHDLRFYYAGATNLFSDMKLINDFYKPNLAFVPISGVGGMSSHTAAYAAKNFLPGVKTYIPIRFRPESFKPDQFPELNGDPEEFKKELKKLGVDAKVIHPKTFLGNAAFIE
jgi:L-ascorbate metabolism protein UlaG (beta-lactamase superfamily)